MLQKKREKYIFIELKKNGKHKETFYSIIVYKRFPSCHLIRKYERKSHAWIKRGNLNSVPSVTLRENTKRRKSKPRSFEILNKKNPQISVNHK